MIPFKVKMEKGPARMISRLISPPVRGKPVLVVVVAIICLVYKEVEGWEEIMLIYLIQHADAVSEEENPARPISEAGNRDISKVAAYLSRLDVRVNQILYSKKLRASQTAEIIAKSLTLNSYKELTESDGLLPLDGPSVWDDRLKYLTDDLMLVGHMPHLGKLAGLLLCGDADRNIISFQTACVVCLERDEKAIWSLRWMLTPGIIISADVS